MVVVVAPDAAEPVAGAGDAGFFGDVGESADTVIAIERVAYFNAAIAIVAVAAVDKVDVLPAIGVKVGDTDAGAEFFQVDGDALVAFAMCEADAGFFGGVTKANGINRAGLSGCGGKDEKQ
jgi:hypothetical protein